MTTEKLILPMVEATTTAIPISKTTTAIITNLSGSHGQKQRPTIIIYPTGKCALLISKTNPLTLYIKPQNSELYIASTNDYTASNKWFFLQIIFPSYRIQCASQNSSYAVECTTLIDNHVAARLALATSKPALIPQMPQNLFAAPYH